MTEHLINTFSEAENALRSRDLAQALYDDGKEVMANVLLNLHGAEHQVRRTIEFRVFGRGFFRYYEHELFPQTLHESLSRFVEAGYCDLVEFGYRVTMNLTADFAGVDRPERSEEETEALLGMVRKFSEGATLVHSTRDRDEVNREVREALEACKQRFLFSSVGKRERLVKAFEAGEIAEDELPRDVITVLLRNRERLELPEDVFYREIAFYLQAGSHSTGNSTTHAMHNIFRWCQDHPGERSRILNDPLFAQRCVHESLRLHPASPVAWRKPVKETELDGISGPVKPGDRVVIDLHEANRDKHVFGDDADTFNPYRPVPKGKMPFGLTFGIGVHSCLGRDLDGGVVPKPNTDPEQHQYGIVPLLVRRLLQAGAEPDPEKAPERDPKTERPNWGYYPIIFNADAGEESKR